MVDTRTPVQRVEGCPFATYSSRRTPLALLEISPLESLCVLWTAMSGSLTLGSACVEKEVLLNRQGWEEFSTRSVRQVPPTTVTFAEGGKNVV